MIPCLLPYYADGYEPPTPDMVDALIRLAGWSQTETAKIVGVSFNPKKGSTTIRKWRSPVDSKEHRSIPYSAWRLMLLSAGLVSIGQLDDELIAQHKHALRLVK